MKSFLLLLAMASIFSCALAGRQLQQALLDFEVCDDSIASVDIVETCCTNFKYGNITMDLKGNPWPSKNTCTATGITKVNVTIRPLNHVLDNKATVEEYKNTPPVPTTVTEVLSAKYYLIKYDPKHSVWGDASGNLCICP